MDADKTVRQILEEHADHEYRDFSGSLNPDEMYPMLGVRIPVLRQIAGRLVREYGISALDRLTDGTYEEVLMQGVVIAKSRLPEEEKKPYIDEYLLKCGDGWSLTDCLASSFKPKDSGLWMKWVLDYARSDSNAMVRFGYVMMMKLLKDEYIDDIINSVVSRPSEIYYIEMAQAWLLATAAIRYGGRVEKLLEEGVLNRFTHNKTIQKMVESYRISDEVKERVRRMKK